MELKYGIRVTHLGKLAFIGFIFYNFRIGFGIAKQVEKPKWYWRKFLFNKKLGNYVVVRHLNFFIFKSYLAGVEISMPGKSF